MRLLRSTARRAARLALVFTTATLAAACVDWNGPDGGADDTFSIARGLWEDGEPAAYEYVIQRRCLSCPADRNSRRVTVTVRDGTVTNRIYTGTTDAVPAGEATYYPTIDGLFVELAQLLESEGDVNRVVYNGTLGYPLSVLIVPRSTADEVGWDITTFTELDT